ncbi:MAG TPA: hypothetical protein VLH56_19665 [Dissulfurispiraceae bacterium]|nr:hypothetical protein [Dissulfurispiraceae bacterium]
MKKRIFGGTAAPKKSFPLVISGGPITGHFHDRIMKPDNTVSKVRGFDAHPLRIGGTTEGGAGSSKYDYANNAQFMTEFGGPTSAILGGLCLFDVWTGLYRTAADEIRRYNATFVPAKFQVFNGDLLFYTYPNVVAGIDALVGAANPTIKANLSGLCVSDRGTTVGPTIRELFQLNATATRNGFIRFCNNTTGLAAGDGWNFGLLADSANLLLRTLEANGLLFFRDSTNADLAVWDFAKKILAFGQSAASQKFTGNSQALSFNARHFKGSWGTDLLELYGLYRLNTGEYRSAVQNVNGVVHFQSDNGFDWYMTRGLTGAIDSAATVDRALSLYNDGTRRRVHINLGLQDTDFDVSGMDNGIIHVDAATSHFEFGSSQGNVDGSNPDLSGFLAVAPSRSDLFVGAPYVCTPATEIDVRNRRVFRLNAGGLTDWFRLTNPKNLQEVILINVGSHPAKIDFTGNDTLYITVNSGKSARLIYDAYANGGLGWWFPVERDYSSIYQPVGSYVQSSSLESYGNSLSPAINGFVNFTDYQYLYKRSDDMITCWVVFSGLADASGVHQMFIPNFTAATLSVKLRCLSNGVLLSPESDLYIGATANDGYIVASWGNNVSHSIMGQFSFPVHTP